MIDELDDAVPDYRPRVLTCPICGNEFVPRGGRQVVCGKRRCVRKRIAQCRAVPQQRAKAREHRETYRRKHKPLRVRVHFVVLPETWRALNRSIT